ncbi:porin [Paraburkholderia sp. J67]|uniref:porin n=1 Tax=Paraburkholderia sp. J67 TaxID=2805435 RepID=UPI002ABDC170|nr:porin [Paraburkholderia sp. J67]
MKKIIMTGLGLALCASAAHAENSVTLYGIVDEGIDFTTNTNGQQNYEMQSGYASGSRWGIKGQEDLGNGVAAIFNLENGFDVNSGASTIGGRMFGRQAFVGLQSDKFGSVTFGRQYDSVVDYLAPLTANGWYSGYLFSHPYDNDNTDNTFRVNNAIKYASPSIAGLTFGGVYGFSNVAGGFANNRLLSIGAAFSSGAFSAAAAYMDINNVGANTGGAVATNDASFYADHQRVYGAGLSYVLGSTTFGFVYTDSLLENPSGNAYVGGTFNVAGNSSLRFDNFEVNVKHDFSPSFFVQAMYTYTLGRYSTGTGTSHPKWHQAGVTFDYLLSKRTDVYLQGTFQQVADGETGTFLDDAFITGADGSSSSSRQIVVRAAIRHSF